jgi:hypothetical protein
MIELDIFRLVRLSGAKSGEETFGRLTEVVDELSWHDTQRPLSMVSLWRFEQVVRRSVFSVKQAAPFDAKAVR